jgi:hypothetical protein
MPLTLRGGSCESWEVGGNVEENKAGIEENEEDQEGGDVAKACCPNEAVSRFQSFHIPHTRTTATISQVDPVELNMSTEFDRFSSDGKSHMLDRIQSSKTPPTPMNFSFTIAARSPTSTPPAPYCYSANPTRTIIPHDQRVQSWSSNPAVQRGIAGVPSASHQAQASPSFYTVPSYLDTRRAQQHQLGVQMMRTQMQNLKGDQRSRFIAVDDKDMKDVAVLTEVAGLPNVELEQVLLGKHRRLVEQQRITNELLAQIREARGSFIASGSAKTTSTVFTAAADTIPTPPPAIAAAAAQVFSSIPRPTSVCLRRSPSSVPI